MPHSRLFGLPLLFLCALSTSNSKLQYRNLKIADISSAATLCQRALYLENGFSAELLSRYNDIVIQGYKHCMLVAADAETQQVVGFAEIGTLPSPVLLTTIWNGAEVESYPEMPYLGNVCVDDRYRRQGIGKRLVAIGCKVAVKWGHDRIFAAVEPDNMAAREMYLKAGFTVALDETLQPKRSATAPPRLYLSKAVLI